MSRRIIIQFICDVCSRIESIEQMNINQTGAVAILSPYPKGWRYPQGSNQIDICPDCVTPQVEAVKRAVSR